ncbi:MAG: hypothetical protein E7Z92_05075 [Cyanobacteria bacterium SIG31]|nr:hypothetical protein [Cyanobacteria bacterium SIG31]
MNISSNRTLAPNFKAYRVAQIKNYLSNKEAYIDLYELAPHSVIDREFINKISEKSRFDFTKLCPRLSTFEQERWRKVFDYCIDRVSNCADKALVAISNNRFCGIMTFNGEKNVNLSGICSIPDEFGKKVPQTGKSLFYYLFKHVKESGAKNIELEAVENGPFNVVKKYEELGFKKQLGEYSGYTKMVSNKYNTDLQLKSLAKELDYVECKPEKTDLNMFLD